MAVFTQFSSDLDESTKTQLEQGAILMELLKQPLGRPLSLGEQVVTLVLALHKEFLGTAKKDVKDLQNKVLAFFNEQEGDLIRNIEISGLLQEDMEQRIIQLYHDFLKKEEEKLS